jgi:hypothetical protein
MLCGRYGPLPAGMGYGVMEGVKVTGGTPEKPGPSEGSLQTPARAGCLPFLEHGNMGKSNPDAATAPLSIKHLLVPP